MLRIFWRAYGRDFVVTACNASFQARLAAGRKLGWKYVGREVLDA